MSLAQNSRNRRYLVTANSLNIVFSLDSNTVILPIINCSIGGILAEQNSAHDNLKADWICSDVKIVGEKFELPIGRLMCRGVKAGKVRFSLVDGKLPLDGELSAFLQNPLGTRPHDVELNPLRYDLSVFARPSKSVDLFSKCYAFSTMKTQWQQSPQYLYNTIRLPSKGVRVHLKLKRKNGRKDFIVFGTNDYLNLAAHPAVGEAAKRAIDKYGYGSTGSPLTTGLTELHEKLADRMARLFQKESAMLFTSGYTANVGTIASLTSTNDLMVADFLAHASIHDAMQMSPATSKVYKHNNVSDLNKVLSQTRNNFAGCLILTEGVFSMDGNIAPLDKISAVARKHRARLFVDEAHSFGILGHHHLGAAEYFDVIDRVDLIMGTFSKIGGGVGGFLVGEKEVIDWLQFYARSSMFSVAAPPSAAAAALAALDIVEEEDDRHLRLQNNIRHFVHGLREMGYDISPNHSSAIIPVIVGDSNTLGVMNRVLIDHGIFVTPIVYPAVARNSARFRFALMADHSPTDIDYALVVLQEAAAVANAKFLNSQALWNKQEEVPQCAE